MNPTQISAQYAAYTWFLDQPENATATPADSPKPTPAAIGKSIKIVPTKGSVDCCWTLFLFPRSRHVGHAKPRRICKQRSRKKWFRRAAEQEEN